jgi:hypothetical protein
MSELLSSLKADLTSRRMLPLLAIAGLALLGALGFVVLGSKSSAPTTSTLAPVSTQHVAALPGPSVASAPANPNAAASETTIGASYQHHGKMRNPFAPVPGMSSPTTTTSSGGGSGSGASSSSQSSGSGSGSGGGSPSASGGSGSGSGGSSPPPSGEAGPRPPAPIALYHVDVSLQRLSEEGKPVGKPQSFHDVIELQPLPSKQKALVAPEGVTGNGTGLAFLLVGEEIIHGKATCIPSPANCQAIDLKLGVPEELQVLEAEGTVVAYKLTVTKIEKVSGSASAAAVHPSAAGSALLVRRHLSIPSSAAFDGKLGTIVGGSGAASAHAAGRARHAQK